MLDFTPSFFSTWISLLETPYIKIMWKSILEKSVCVHNAVFSSCENRRKSTTSFLNHQIKIGKILPKITFYSNKYPFYNNSLPQRHLYIDIN